MCHSQFPAIVHMVFTTKDFLFHVISIYIGETIIMGYYVLITQVYLALCSVG